MTPFLIPAAERAPMPWGDGHPPHEWRTTEPRPVVFIMGVDLGQARDFSAIVINEVSLSKRQRHHPGDPFAVFGEVQTIRRHELRHVERLPLGMSYPAVIEAVRDRFTRIPAQSREPKLIVDATGVGRPVVDEMRRAGLRPIGCTITGGSGWSEDRGSKSCRVAKALLASTVAVALETDRLTVSADGPHRDTLQGELAAFRVKVNPNANETFEAWREADHDDLVLAAAMAVWLGDHTEPKMQANPAFRFTSR